MTRLSHSQQLARCHICTHKPTIFATL